MKNHIVKRPEVRVRHHLLPIEEEYDPDQTLPMPHSIIPTIQDRFLMQGWNALTSQEQSIFLKEAQVIWNALSPDQRNDLVLKALGSSVRENPLHLMYRIYDRVALDLFRLDDFCDMLFLLVSDLRGFGFQDSGTPLLDPHQRALHFFTLTSATTPAAVNLTFVLTYLPRAFFACPLPQQPVTPLPPAEAII